MPDQCIKTTPEERAKRTDELLAYWRDKPQEWKMLHAALCLPHAFSALSPMYGLFENRRLAERCDEIARAEISTEKKA